MKTTSGSIGSRSGHLHIIISSSLEEIDGVCSAARELLTGGNAEKNSFAVDLLLRESLTNAILHGNESKHWKMVTVDIRIGRKWIVLRVADQGAGFAWRSASSKIPASTEIAGRGMAIVTRYAARVKYNMSGSRVEFWIKKASE